MTPSKTDIKTQLEALLTDAIQAFCDDISGMFGVEMESKVCSGSAETVQALKKKFKKLSAVITVKASGILAGDLHIVFDKEGLFTLAGTIVMLPEQRILTNRKMGSEKDAEELHDVVGETGNLLVGSWDRIFRENLEGHTHFLQTGTFIGNAWDDPEKEIGIKKEEEFLFFPFDMTVGSFPGFHGGVLFPESIFQKTTDDVPAGASQEQEDVSEVAQEPESRDAETQEVSGGSAEPAPEASKSEEPQSQDGVPPLDGHTEPEHRETAQGAVSGTIQKMVQSLPMIPLEHARTLLNVCAKEVMKKEILWGTPEDSVQQAMQKMQQADAACMVVGSSGSLEGIVTWIDLAEAVSVYLRPAFSRWRRPADDATLQIRVKVIMTRPVRTINPQTSLEVAMEDMCRHRLRCLPVVNEQGKVEGVLTAFDIFKVLLNTSPDISVIGQ
jgi:CBS domain-containing protein